ncbi:hypothetical protein PLESTB_000463300 [Pleodorina starrii]|uniref:Lipoyl-binding domain-containing protein n=1 Tax=Pleodorina starrii TaxID=330485 RepID=A0A9W6F0F9_9CHLO|nr:hypothetical protein PLESTM_000797800 [Pleodorina starrii]GLC51076.1 hypothetical protein PLESTB_000463300 [Pleodorina starrii]GLC63434.1 hypothetical protein PLESTF_000035800 [Pleodorina starrii]
MASRHALGQAMQLLGLSVPCSSACGLPLQAARLISASAFRLWPDVIVPPMGESIKEGSIAAVLKQVGQSVREDEVIAQIETDKVTIDIRAPAAGVLQQLNVKPSDVVVAGQVVAVVGAGAPAAEAATPAAAAPAAAATTLASTSGRSCHIHFPPRVTSAGARISDLPGAEYAAALAAAEKPAVATATVEATAAAAPPPPPAPAAPEYPMPAAKAAPPPISKNKLQYITRPDGRGGPPRRPLTERELEMINLGGVY